MKKYRNIKTKTISLKLSKSLVDILDLKVTAHRNQNMSILIEEAASRAMLKYIPVITTGKRKYNNDIYVKKTFTFSEEFVRQIKKTRNMSMCVELLLKYTFSQK